MTNIHEDTWFSDKLKRTAQAAAAKLPGGAKAAAQKEIRERANSLIDVWKAQEAAGRKRTIRELRNWLKQGDNAIDPNLFKKALTSVNDKVSLSDIDNELSSGELRDIFVAIARQEKMLQGAGGIAQTPKQQSAANQRDSNTERSRKNTRRSEQNTKRSAYNRNQDLIQNAAAFGQRREIESLKRQVDNLRAQVASLQGSRPES